ncbi:hypothetical protein MTO96_005353 [Rhipicephalus appendiculatus]
MTARGAKPTRTFTPEYDDTRDRDTEPPRVRLQATHQFSGASSVLRPTAIARRQQETRAPLWKKERPGRLRPSLR